MGPSARPLDYLDLLCRALAQVGVDVEACAASVGRARIRLAPALDERPIDVTIDRDVARPSWAVAGGLALRFEGQGEADERTRRALAVLARLLERIGPLLPPDLDSEVLRGLDRLGAREAMSWAFPFCTVEHAPGPGGPTIRQVLVRTTSRCNQSCPFCSAPPPLPQPSQRALARLFSVLDRRAPAATITLTGGEPTLRSDLPEIVAAALGAGEARDVEIQTNAVGLARQGAVVALPRSHRLRFFVSLHAVDEAIYDRCTGTKGMLDRALAGLDALVADRRRIVISVVCTRWNAEHLGELVEAVAERFGASPSLAIHFSITLCPEHRPTAGDALIEYPVLAPLLERAWALAERRGIRPEPLLSSSHAAIPACFLRDARHRARPTRSLVEPEQGGAGSRGRPVWVHGARCQECAEREGCRGFPAEYVSRFGAPEVAPCVVEGDGVD